MEQENVNIEDLEQQLAELQTDCATRTKQLEDTINAYNALLLNIKMIIQTNELLINKIIKEAQEGK